MKPELRSALHMVVYIRELGEEPPPLRKFECQKWTMAVQKQFQRLQKTKGLKAAKAACLRGRVLIAEKGLIAATADSLPRPKPGESLRCLFCRKRTWPTLDSAWVALAPLKEQPEVRKPNLLGVYRCPRDSGWHLGHNHCWAGGSLCVGEHK